MLEIGLLSLGGDGADPATGAHPSATERQRAIVELAVRAESLGFDAVWIGDPLAGGSAFAASQLVVAAIAARTERVRIGAAIALGRLDPVRVAEDGATLDAISNGRLEIAVGCGAEDAGRLRENVALLRRLWSETNLTWSGRFRAPLDAVTVEPRPVQAPHPPLWIGAGASLGSVDLAAALGLPLMLAGSPTPAVDFATAVERYRERFAAAGHDPAGARVSCCQAVAGGASPSAIAERIAKTCESLRLDLHLSTFDRDADLDAFAAQVAPVLRGERGRSSA